jgi:replicative DNA helicase
MTLQARPELRVLPGGRDVPPLGVFGDDAGRFRDDSPLQIPPHDLDAEAAVLSALLADGSKLALVPSLRPKHFFSESHRRVFEAIGWCVDAKIDPDVINVGTRLRDTQRLDQVGGMAYLTDLLNVAPTLRVQAWAKTIFDKWRARSTIALCQRVVNRGYLGVDDTQAWIDEAARALSEVGRLGRQGTSQSNRERMKRIYADVAARGNGTKAASGIPTGIAALDALTGGMALGELTILAALTGVGKTAFGAQLLAHAAEKGIGGLFVSTEDPADDVQIRILCQRARVTMRQFRESNFSQTDWNRLVAANAIVDKLPYRIEDADGADVDTVRGMVLAETERIRAEGGPPLGLVVVDYVQNLQAPSDMGNAERPKVIAHAMMQLDLLAKESGAHILVLAQQKELETKGKRRPSPGLGCWSWSAEVERKAQNVIYLHRSDKLDEDGNQVKDGDPERAMLIVAKCRNGRKGTAPIRYAGEHYRFWEERVFDR